MVVHRGGDGCCGGRFREEVMVIVGGPLGGMMERAGGGAWGR